jgi:hypothetical protein
MAAVTTTVQDIGLDRDGFIGRAILNDSFLRAITIQKRV